MALIREDDSGVYAQVGGYICRPNLPTRFKKGDKTDCVHFRGSGTVGVGKLQGRANYEEYWKTVDLAPFVKQAQGDLK